MSEAIRDRRPTKADANAVDHVLVWSKRTPSSEWQWFADGYYNVEDGEIWKPIDQTPPPEPEKPKRYETVVWVTDHNRDRKVPVREVLPGDPPDLDAFIAQAVRMFELTNPLIELDERELGITRMRFDKARHGEGGDA